MPLYDYECLSCGDVFELRQSFSDEPQGTCPQCAGKSRRKFHAVPIIYKGSGFYTTDYKRTGYSGVSSDKAEEGSKERDEAAKASTDSPGDKRETTKTTTGSSTAKKEADKEA